MGKNQIYKSMQRARHNGEFDTTDPDIEPGTVDASFHSPEWHAARMEALQSRRLSWEEWKEKVKEEEFAKSKLREEEERVMMEYRAQLAADREKKMKESDGRNKRKRSGHHHHDKKLQGIEKHRKKKVSKKHHARHQKHSTASSLSPTDSSPIRLSEYLKS